MSQENVQLIRRLFAARAAHDVDGALSCLAEDFELDASRRVIDPMVVHGHDGFTRFIAALDDVWAQQTVEPEDLIEVGDRVVVPVRLTSRGHSGATANARAAWVITVDRGKITHACIYQSTQDAFEALDRPA